MAAVVLLLAVDALIAANRMNPVDAADDAATDAGWRTNQLRLRSFEASGGPLGSSAVVEYSFAGPEAAEKLVVQLRRPLLSSHWEVVTVEIR